MIRITVLAVCCMVLGGCDPQRKDKCEWILMPEPEHKRGTPEGYVSFCARNYTLGRQRCHLTATYEEAEKMVDVTFRYSDMKVDTSSFPWRITEFKTCTPESKE